MSMKILNYSKTINLPANNNQKKEKPSFGSKFDYDMTNQVFSSLKEHPSCGIKGLLNFNAIVEQLKQKFLSNGRKDKAIAKFYNAANGQGTVGDSLLLSGTLTVTRKNGKSYVKPFKIRDDSTLAVKDILEIDQSVTNAIKSEQKAKKETLAIKRIESQINKHVSPDVYYKDPK